MYADAIPQPDPAIFKHPPGYTFRGDSGNFTEALIIDIAFEFARVDKNGRKILEKCIHLSGLGEDDIQLRVDNEVCYLLFSSRFNREFLSFSTRHLPPNNLD